MPWTTCKTTEMSTSRTRLFAHRNVPSAAAFLQSAGGVAVGPILNASKLKALLLADGNSARKWKALDLSSSNIRKIELSLGEVAALDFECLTHLDLDGNLLVLLDGHSLPFPHLQTLRASNCRINTITNFGSHFRLRQLDLSGNQLTSIINLSNTPLRFTLRELNLARNQIRMELSVPVVLSLLRLSDFKGLAALSTFKSLEVLDLRQNPICNFGNVAEGFALICCTTIRQLNGHTVSPGVREAVDTWARDEACGRATVAAVEAFRETLQHPDGPSLLCSTSHPSMVGRLNRMRSVRAGPELPYASTADASVNSVADSCDAVYIKRHAVGEEDCRSVHSRSCLHSDCNQGLHTVVTRAVSTAVEAAADISRGSPVDVTCSSSDVQAATASCATQSEDGTEKGQACTVGDNEQRSTECYRCGSPETRDSAALLLERMMGMMKLGNKLEVQGEQCKLSLRQTILQSQYYHNSSTTSGACARAASSSERSSARTERLTCCTGTRTPDARIRHLEFPRRSSSSESVSRRDEVKSEEGGHWAGTPPSQPADSAPITSPESKERGESSINATLERDIPYREED